MATSLTAPARFCIRCGRERVPGAVFCVGCGRRFEDGPATAPAASRLPEPVVPEPDDGPAVPYPVRYRPVYDARRSRLPTVLRLVLAVPHIVVWAGMTVISMVLAIPAWFAALVAGRVPGPLHRYQAASLAHATRTWAYLMLVSDAFPPFPWQAAGGYRVRVEIDPPARLSRRRTLLVVPMSIPSVITSVLFAVVSVMLAVGGWWAVLATGRLPRTIAEMQELAIGFGCRTLGYMPLLLTDVYPWYESGPLLQRSRRAAVAPTAVE